MSIDSWANFFFNEKLDPKQLDEDSIMELIYLCEELAKKGPPKRRPYKERLVSRRLAVDTALDLGIDLIDFKSKWNGKIILGRGLLDVWMIAYRERYGSTTGTRGEWEAKRRNIKTRLAKKATVDPLAPGTGMELKTRLIESDFQGIELTAPPLCQSLDIKFKDESVHEDTVFYGQHPKDCRCIVCDIPYYGSDGQGGY